MDRRVAALLAMTFNAEQARSGACTARSSLALPRPRHGGFNQRFFALQLRRVADARMLG
jgi:hypothetical protein